VKAIAPKVVTKTTETILGKAVVSPFLWAGAKLPSLIDVSWTQVTKPKLKPYPVQKVPVKITPVSKIIHKPIIKHEEIPSLKDIIITKPAIVPAITPEVTPSPVQISEIIVSPVVSQITIQKTRLVQRQIQREISISRLIMGKPPERKKKRKRRKKARVRKPMISLEILISLWICL